MTDKCSQFAIATMQIKVLNEDLIYQELTNSEIFYKLYKKIIDNINLLCYDSFAVR